MGYYEQRVSALEMANKNVKKYSDEINKRAKVDTNDDGFCCYYFACGYNGCEVGELMSVLTGPVLRCETDKDGKCICFPELAGMSARVKDGKITEFYFE